MPQGGSGTPTLTLTPQNGFTGTVTLSLQGAPSGVTLSPTSVNVTGSSPVTQTLTLAVASSVPQGTYPLTLQATSGSLTKTVNLSLTVTGAPNFTLSLNPTSLSVPQGGSGTPTLTLTPQNGFTGTVTLSLQGAPSGVTLSPTSVNVTGSSPVTQTLTLAVASSVPQGTYPLTLQATSGSLTKTVNLSLTVTGAPNFTLSLNPTSLSVPQGGSGTPTLTLTPQNGFTGTVTLSLQGAPSGVTLSPTSVNVTGSSPVTQTLTLAVASSVPQGTYPLTLQATSGSLTKTVNLSLTVTGAPNFTLSLNPTSLSVPQGGSGTPTLTLTPQNGFTGTVTLSLQGAPSGVTLSPTSVNVTGSSPVTQTLTLAVASSVPQGTYPLTLQATSGSLTKTVNLSLTVTGAPNFTLSLNPTSLSVPQGGSGTPTLTLTPQNGFTGTVTLSLQGAPSGVTLSPTSVNVTGSSPVTQTLTLAVASSVPQGTYPLTLQATSGSLTKTVNLSLTVTTHHSI
ncbi:hypothetical protein ACLWNE_10405 [Thermus oshimai]|uniref:COG1470 family protein n=1 Tax=Thermus oshimai TaxID=56957 RepID=UPI0039A47DFB